MGLLSVHIDNAKLAFAITFLGCFLLSTPVQALVLEVDDDGTAPFTSIQAAINAALPGQDEVSVHCGTYLENVSMVEQVHVKGAGPACTTIDGGERWGRW